MSSDSFCLTRHANKALNIGVPLFFTRHRSEKKRKTLDKYFIDQVFICVYGSCICDEWPLYQ